MTADAVDVSAVLDGLKDFQRQTVEYVFDRLYGDKPTSRFLVADEVGLGKTLVARGLIAKTIEHLKEAVERIDVVYVCSNAEIARQNIQRLNVTSTGGFALASRITLLPLRLHELTRSRLNLVSFTPGTSLDLKSSGGTARERSLLHRLLAEAWGTRLLSTAGGRRVFQGDVGHQNFQWWLNDIKSQPIDRELVEAFVRDIGAHDVDAASRGAATLRGQFEDLRQRFGRGERKRPPADNAARRRFIGTLRDRLARVCVHALEPDLIILDEFQRFKHLLRADEPAGELAQQLFEFRDRRGEAARVVLLSATPYKMYTVSEDVDDDHYSDLVDTLRFLFDDERKTRAFESEMRAYREALFHLDPADLAQVTRMKRRLERRLREVIVRTERLSTTPDRNGMLVSRGLEPRLESGDVEAFASMDRAAIELEAGDVLEYWKSAPYLPNFMDGYKLAHAIEHAGDGNVTPLRRALLRWEDIEQYRQLDLQNARLRALAADVLDDGAWQLLWIPPSLPYYQPSSPFDTPASHELTKRLVFSVWAVAPKAIAALLSYEAERRMLGRRARSTAYSEARMKLKPLLRLSQSKGRLPGLPVLGLLYPSVALARLGDPAGIAAEAGRRLTQRELLHVVSERVQARLTPLIARTAIEGGVDERWYWATGFVLDLFDDEDAAVAWLGRRRVSEIWAGPEERGDDFARHLDVARSVRVDDLGRPPDDLIDVVSRLAVASPAVAALRALARVTGGVDAFADPVVRDGAARIAWGFRSLFNLPEVTALVRKPKAYWKAVVDYCFAGCLQAALDEYVHVLVEWLGLTSREPHQVISSVADTVHSAVSLRTASYEIRDVAAGHDGDTFPKRSFRARFALRFGDNRADEERDTQRATLVREAFNSPFWPFVLATTSVGQEGLDFHLYCHSIVHWNLPANPVDLEQREGRVHRYKGHAIRKNLAEAYGPVALAPGVADPWQALFDEGKRHRHAVENDLVPSWIFTGGRARIERLTAMLPLSRDAARFEALKRSLAAYRLAFGQPRQEDLLAFLGRTLGDPEVETIAEQLRIDLSPR